VTSDRPRTAIMLRDGRIVHEAGSVSWTGATPFMHRGAIMKFERPFTACDEPVREYGRGT
jgi:hypothetical protein